MIEEINDPFYNLQNTELYFTLYSLAYSILLGNLFTYYSILIYITLFNSILV